MNEVRCSTFSPMASTPGADAPHAPTNELPGIHALFLIRFDLRKGYTITWKKSLPNVQLDGSVEYKSLPSGLHNVREDLVYFLHDSYVGLSAFSNVPADEASRNALMLAVGILLPIGEGRMGKSWTYAEHLRTLSRDLAINPDNTSLLEAFWEQQKQDDHTRKSAGDSETTLSSKHRPFQGYKRNRGMSNAPATIGHKQSLSPDHPATALPDFLRAFGPLVFPLYRAALLRKRILLVGEPPVQSNCNYVYALSILTSMPQNVLELLPYDTIPDLRVKPLFNVGLYDASSLSPSQNSTKTSIFPPSWIACTTDDVLATKPELYDILVRLPPSYSKDAPSKIYPKIYNSTPSLTQSSKSALELKASQRDARRFQNLIYYIKKPSVSASGASALSSRSSVNTSSSSSGSSTFSTSPIVEPVSWSLAAYTSFLWWASAGEKRHRAEEQELEMQQDEDLLLHGLPNTDSDDAQRELQAETSLEIALIAYFQRLTSLLIDTMSHAIDRQSQTKQRLSGGYRSSTSSTSSFTQNVNSSTAESDRHPLLDSHDDGTSSEDDNDEPVEITADDLRTMGLDPWSTADQSFVADMLSLWWGRKAHVNGGRVDCCGIRLL